MLYNVCIRNINSCSPENPISGVTHQIDNPLKLTYFSITKLSVVEFKTCSSELSVLTCCNSWCKQMILPAGES